MSVLAKLVSKSGSLFRSRSGKKELQRSSSSCSSSSCSSYGYESDNDLWEESEGSVPADVPKGCMAVYVGSGEKHRFVVGTHLLKNPVFQVLLQRAADEYGYENTGALTIPCELALFEHFLWLLNNNDPMIEVK